MRVKSLCALLAFIGVLAAASVALAKEPIEP